MDAAVKNTGLGLLLLLAGGVVLVPAAASATPSIPPEGAGLPPAVEAQAPSTQGVATNLQTIQSLVGLEETGSVKPNYGSITVDNGGLTYGAYQDNTISGGGVGSLPRLLSAYVAAGGQYAAQLKPYAPFYRKVGGRVTNVANMAGLESVLRKAASDPLMQKMQQQSWDKNYLVPAMESARANGVTSPFGVALFTDIETNGGLASIVRVAHQQVPVVGNAAQEKQFIDAMLAARQHRYQVLASRASYAKYLPGWTSRSNDFKSILAHNGTGMVGTLNVAARGGRIPGGTAADAATFATFVKTLPSNPAQALAAVESKGAGLGSSAVATAPEAARKPSAAAPGNTLPGAAAPTVTVKPATGDSPASVTVTVTFGPATATTSGALATAPAVTDPSLTQLLAALTKLLASLQQTVDAINQGLSPLNARGNNSPASGNNSPGGGGSPSGGGGSPSGGGGSPSNGSGSPTLVASNNGPMSGPAGIGSSPASPSGSGNQVGRNTPTTPVLTEATGSTVALHPRGNPHGGVGWIRNSSSLGGN